MIMTYTEASLGLNPIMNCLKEKGIFLNKKINSSLKRLVILTFYRERFLSFLAKTWSLSMLLIVPQVK